SPSCFRPVRLLPAADVNLESLKDPNLRKCLLLKSSLRFPKTFKIFFC
ncbi:unnamed protein product, partial [Arabidopsis halleri]